MHTQFGGGCTYGECAQRLSFKRTRTSFSATHANTHKSIHCLCPGWVCNCARPVNASRCGQDRWRREAVGRGDFNVRLGCACELRLRWRSVVRCEAFGGMSLSAHKCHRLLAPCALAPCDCGPNWEAACIAGAGDELAYH